MNTKNNFEEFPVFNASRMKIALVVSRQNSVITEKVVQQVLDALYEYEIEEEKVKIEFVAGPSEVLMVVNQLVKSGGFDCIVAIGTLVAETAPRFAVEGQILAQELTSLSLGSGVPIGNGFIFADRMKTAKLMMYIPAEVTAGTLEVARWLSTLKPPKTASVKKAQAKKKSEPKPGQEDDQDMEL